MILMLHILKPVLAYLITLQLSYVFSFLCGSSIMHIVLNYDDTHYILNIILIVMI